MRTVCRNKKAHMVKDEEDVYVFFVGADGELRRYAQSYTSEEALVAEFEARFGPALEVANLTWGGLMLTAAGMKEAPQITPEVDSLDIF